MGERMMSKKEKEKDNTKRGVKYLGEEKQK
jgi:hypothetical protein